MSSDPQDNYLKTPAPVLSPKWLASWFLTVDHKRIAILYMILVLTAFAAGGAYALLVRFELYKPNVSQETMIVADGQSTLTDIALRNGYKMKTTTIEQPDGTTKAVTRLDKIDRVLKLKENAGISFRKLTDRNGAAYAEDVRPEDRLLPQGTEVYLIQEVLSPEAYNRVFTMHGAIMVFLFIIPGIPGILGNFLLPIMLGAKDVAFPKVNLLSWYVFLVGMLLALTTLIWGGVDTGWTFYTPYSTSSNSPVILMTFAAFILGFASIFTGLNFIVTIHKMRAPGMTWYDMPLFCWGMYATALVQVLATPVLGITLLLLIIEKAAGIGIFDPALGGDPVLYQHFFWFYSHPAVYIMILPGFAIVSELITVHSHKCIFGYKLIAWSSVMIAILGFFVWGHHMFVAGESRYSAMIFSFLTFFIGIPSAIKVFNWMATMYKGHIKLTTPMLFAVAFLINFAIGGLTGLFLGTLGLDVHLHSTYFVVAHFHYVMMGSAVFAFLGGLYHWWPKMTGKVYSEAGGVVSWVLIFLGFNVTFLNQFQLGLHGMPRRYHDYAGFLKQDFFETFHGFSTVGSVILGVGFVIMAIVLLASLFSKKKAPSNPWGGLSMEWMTTSPPPTLNFHYDPVLEHGPYDYDKVTPENL